LPASQEPGRKSPGQARGSPDTPTSGGGPGQRPRNVGSLPGTSGLRAVFQPASQEVGRKSPGQARGSLDTPTSGGGPGQRPRNVGSLPGTSGLRAVFQPASQEVGRKSPGQARGSPDTPTSGGGPGQRPRNVGNLPGTSDLPGGSPARLSGARPKIPWTGAREPRHPDIGRGARAATPKCQESPGDFRSTGEFSSPPLRRSAENPLDRPEGASTPRHRAGGSGSDPRMQGVSQGLAAQAGVFGPPSLAGLSGPLGLFPSGVGPERPSFRKTGDQLVGRSTRLSGRRL
jgi:hypothetical protein